MENKQEKPENQFCIELQKKLEDQLWKQCPDWGKLWEQIFCQLWYSLDSQLRNRLDKQLVNELKHEK